MNPLYLATAARITRFIAALSDGPLNKHELARETLTSPSATGKYIRNLLAAGTIHIARWETYGMYGVYIAVYALGDSRNARKPAPKSAKKKNAEYLKRRQKDQERQELHLARRRARTNVNRLKAKPQSWLSALGAV